MSISVKLFDYNVFLEKNIFEEQGKDANEFVIQCFALNKKGKTYCIYIKNFKPFFYVKVKSNFTKQKKDAFIDMLFESMSDNENTRAYYRDSLTACKIVKKNKLYGFDAGEKHKFVYLEFKNTILYSKFKNLWYVYDEETRVKHQVQVKFENEPIEIYEANIPPLLRFFHIKNMSASGWIKMNLKRLKKTNRKTTNCDEEFSIDQKYIIPQNNKEDIVPYKICSFDIEASSSHGDFPIPIKNYKKLADNLVEYWHYNEIIELERELQVTHFRNCIMSAFGFRKPINFIDVVYVKQTRKPSKEKLEKLIDTLIKKPMKNLNKTGKSIKTNRLRWDLDEEDEEGYGSKYKSYLKVQTTIIDLLNDTKFKREDKLNEITDTLTITLPPLKGDKTTFIGSTFWKYGEKSNYYNNVIVLGECSPLDNIDVISVKTERELLLEWTNLIQRENPDIIIGYNIFGFDFKFLFDRACELNVEKQFLKLSKVKNEICGYNEKTGLCKLTESKINIASGTHDLKYITMNGRINIDMYNYFRREYSLESYKLDHVSSNFICDVIKKYEYNDEYTNIYSKNLTGLLVGSYIKFEEIGHSSEYYNEGEKFIVTKIDYDNKIIEIKGNPKLDNSKLLKWGLAKDDVTHHDIFRLTETGNPNDKAIVAKYCVQDCNLVHYLMNKIDVITGFVEMSNICSVPMEYLIMRGQGIKLYSFLAKKCREKETLIPDLNKKRGNEAYEGATVLKPKCGLYLDEPVACVDYSSLYPSSMISENLSHDSKVWFKEYDLAGNLIKETESQNKKYDNLPEYKYVDIKFDTYAYLPNERGKDEKKHVGSKICRYAQFPKHQKGILPSILEELLFARKMTRKMAKFKTVTMKDGSTHEGMINHGEVQTTITDKLGNVTTVETQDIVDTKDTYDDFMKNVFDKRQLGYKVTANSIYGQTGAKTSSFYEPDVAASTTATGRKLLYYGKRIIEEVYGDKICNTPYGLVHSHAEYIYGDSVTGDTPLLLKHKTTGNITFKQIDNLNSDWSEYQGFKVNESNRREKQQASVKDYLIYTSCGWVPIRRVIRHKTKKQMYRVTTHRGVVDVTEDHSLLDKNKNKIKPKDVSVGMELLHNYPEFSNSVEYTKSNKFNSIMNYIENIIGKKSIEEKEAFLKGFFFGDGSCGKYNTKYGIKYSWALNNKNIENCLVLQSLCEEVYNKEFKIDDTIESSGVYKVRPNCGSIKYFVEKYNCMYSENRYKIVPNEILNNTREVRYAFFAGYYMADGAKCENTKTKNIRMSNKGKIGSAMLYYLMSSLGLNVSVNTRSDKKDIYRLTATTNSQRKNKDAIKKIDMLDLNIENIFVYDIETEDGTFNTGFPLIVKNTDSVFMSFKLTDLEGNPIVGKEALKITIDLAKEAGELATKFLKKPHDLEYEKTFLPFCLLSKKRYVGMLYEEDPEKCKRKSMGIVLKRRDNAPIVKDIYGGVVDILMEPIQQGETEQTKIIKAMEFTRKCLGEIANGEISDKKLIITKSLRSFYKNPLQIAHKVLADRMGMRDPGNKPGAGDRIPFMYIQTKGKVRLQGDKIEHPNFIKENNLKPDYGFYITNQIMKPLLQVFSLVLQEMPEFQRKQRMFFNKLEILKDTMEDEEKYENKEAKLKNEEVKKILFEDTLRTLNNAKVGQKSIKSFFK